MKRNIIVSNTINDSYLINFPKENHLNTTQMVFLYLIPKLTIVKKFISTFLIILISGNLAAQIKTKFILKKRNSETEEYYVLKKDKKIKHGTYVKYLGVPGINFLLIENGNYVMGLKEGIWTTYIDRVPKNRIESTGNYKNGQKSGHWKYFYDSMESINDPQNYTLKMSNDKIKSIEVKVHNKELRTLKEGYFNNGKKYGLWNYYDFEGNIIYTYDYTTNKTIYEKDFSNAPLRFTLFGQYRDIGITKIASADLKHFFSDETKNLSKKNLALYENKNASYLGGLAILKYYILKEIDFLKIQKKGINGFTVFSITIDKRGKVEIIEIDRTNISKKGNQVLTKLVKDIPQNWVPKHIDNIPVSSKLKLKLNIESKTNDDSFSITTKLQFLKN